VEILHLDFACAATPSVGHFAALVGAEAPRLDLDPRLVVFFVLGLTFNGVDLQEIVNDCHGRTC
jgi:hypothetical protein